MAVDTGTSTADTAALAALLREILDEIRLIREALQLLDFG